MDGMESSQDLHPMRTLNSFFLLFFVLLSATCAQQPEPLVVDVPMADGTLLKTTVVLPAGEGPFPVILWRSTYGRDTNWVKDAVKKGYAAVIQDVRGMGESQGPKRVFHADGWQPDVQDGRDTVEWISQQPWCNGKIGTSGGSALGITQELLAPTTDKVSAQVVVVGGGRFYGDLAFIGGVWRKNLVEEWLKAIGQPHMIEEWKAHPLDDAYWSYYNFVEAAPRMNAPAIFHGAWYDIFAQGMIDAFVARQENGGEGAKGRNVLIMTWGSHGPDREDDYKYNPNRHDLKISEIYEKFYRYHLRGETDALDGLAKVYYYVLGSDQPGAPGNEWRTAEHWPPYETVATSFYLHPGGELKQDAQPEAAALSFTFDPEHPFPTHGGPNLNIPAGAFDQRKVTEGREDFLPFYTAPLEQPLEITGKVRVRIAVSSDAPDTDFTAKLIDKFPDGREINVLDGIRRVKTRNGFKEFALLLTGPEEVVELEIDLWSTAWIFDKGHQIGLHISSSNFPAYEVNPNTGADYPVEGEPLRKALNTVHMGGDRLSQLILPVRPVE
jgi:predicted acyl esterase